jgi:hypothetical protein
MNAKPWTILTALFALAQSAQHATALGTAFSYQGSLTDSGNAATGNYDMQFYLRDAAFGGNPVGVTNTVAPVNVTNGLFTVLLDFGPGIFGGNNLWLEIGVRTNGSVAAYATLSPRQPLTPSPYALFSPQAGGVTNGAITSAMLANAAVTSSKLADGAVTSQQLADMIALGTNGANGRLDLYQTAAGTISMQLLGSTKQFRIFGDDSAQKVSLDASPGWGELDLLNNNSPSQFAAILTANALGGASLTLNNSNGVNRAVLFGANTGGTLNLYDGSGTNSISLANFGGGLLALNGTTGVNRATLSGLTSGGQMNLFNASSAGTVSMNAAGNSWLTGGSLGVGTTAPAAPLHVRAGSAGVAPDANSGAVFERSGPCYVSVLSPAANETGILFGSPALAEDGGIIYNNGGVARGFEFRCNGNATKMSIDSAGEVTVYRSSGPAAAILYPNYLNAGNAVLSIISSNGIGGAQLWGYGVGGGGLALLRPSDATVTVSAIADDGTGSGLITTSVLQITGGADLSEQFDVEAADGNPQPGMVVCIDPEHPGQLVVSSKAYDRTVAGIVSGAGGIKPGMLMGHQGTIADGNHPIALTGRVYCLADASNGAIEPGDFLTTSTTQGHAMKVTDAVRAQGAILGKAMGALEKGKGLVLVLVTLQ